MLADEDKSRGNVKTRTLCWRRKECGTRKIKSGTKTGQLKFETLRIERRAKSKPTPFADDAKKCGTRKIKSRANTSQMKDEPTAAGGEGGHPPGTLCCAALLTCGLLILFVAGFLHACYSSRDGVGDTRVVGQIVYHLPLTAE
jgi:hypothetical protein